MGFRKAKGEQAAIKMGLYGPSGSGKTFTSLLCAEGLVKSTGKRIAFVDTERGTDFYCQEVKQRRIHPEAFDFDALYTKSIMEVLKEVRSLDPKEYGVVVIDSISHIWEAARNAYEGKTTRAGTIPFHAWGKIKKPYKDLVAFLLSTPMHVFILGRQGNEYGEDEDGELKMVGVKMRSESETPYEPHILIRMEAIKQKHGEPIITAFAEKDRTGILAGKSIQSPSFDSLIKPVLGVLGAEQAKIETQDETAGKDAELADEEDKAKESESSNLLRTFSARLDLAQTVDEVKAIGREINANTKKKMLTADVKKLRERYIEIEQGFTTGRRVLIESPDGSMLIEQG